MAKVLVPPPSDSPCVRNCCLDEQDVCMGCWRTLEEILAWGNADEVHRRSILQKSYMRRDSAAAKNHH